MSDEGRLTPAPDSSAPTDSPDVGADSAPPPPPVAPHGTPPAATPYAPYAPYAPQAPASPPRGKAWIWVVVAVFVLAACVIGSCVALASIGETVSPTGLPSASGDAIAVIRMDGVIEGSGSALDGVVSPRDLDSQFQQAEEDENVKAIVLRINSPGGTVAASEEIAATIKDCSKPVVASIADVGASGAYMAASQCDEILAMPGSSVGSIGVILQIPNLQGLLDKLGVKFQVITAGEYKDAGSSWRALTPTETALLQADVDEIYGQFIDIVAEGRDLERSEVESLATGFAYTGTAAERLGLIDGLGGYRDAIDAAADLGGVDGEPEIIEYDEYLVEDLIGSLIGFSDQLGGPEAALRRMLEGAQQPVPR